MEDKICSACASIDFAGFFKDAQEVVGKRSTEVDHHFLNPDAPGAPFALLFLDFSDKIVLAGISVDHIKSNSSCSCCETLSYTAYARPHTYLVYCIPHTFHDRCNDNAVNSSNELPHLKIYRPDLSQQIANKGPIHSVAFVLRHSKLAPRFELTQPGHRGPEISANLSSLKSAVARRTCPHHLKPQRNQDWKELFERNLPGWSVIDCLTDRIVSLENCVAESGCFDAVEYVTLSYVWGSGQSEGLKPNGRLPTSLPRVIGDAKIVTISLGFRYLWVDRYCIPQPHSKDAHYQIRNMNLIYARSCVTIVAAAGQGPEYGLPGISTTSRRGFEVFHVGSYSIKRMPSDGWVEKQIQHSRWNSRAWTCQEAALSARRLYFTDYFALLENGIDGESYIEGLPDQVCPFNGCIWDELLHMPDAIPYSASYVRRELSFESDAFRAYQGCQAHYNRGQSGEFVMFFGLKIGDNCELSSALLWESTETSSQLQRRAGVQSWTWL